MRWMRKISDQIEDLRARCIFALSLVFVSLLGTLIVVWVDIPRFTALNRSAVVTTSQINDPITISAEQVGNVVVVIVWFLGFVIVGDALSAHALHIRQQPLEDRLRWRLQLLAHCLCPPLRLASPRIENNGQIWLPWIGWQRCGRKLFRKLEAVFSTPMLWFALLILPVLLIEFGLHGFVEQHTWLRLLMHCCTGLIWCAFAVEFIVLLNASDKRWAFVKKHWLDLAIILLPVIMFLRSLRALRAMRLAKLAKAQQLANLSRVYRVRGVAMKAVRALMLLDLFGRVLPASPHRKLQKLKLAYEEKMEELEELQVEIAKVKREIEQQSKPLDATGKAVESAGTREFKPLEVQDGG